MKKVASVTMKLGSPVLMTIVPLMNPMQAANTNVSTIANQMFIPTSVARMPISRPAEPVITPDDRSNSPPIISSATATAMMPRVDATSVQRAMPLSVANCSAVTAKNRNTTPAPSIAPSSGRWSSLVRNETFARRSSTAVAGGSEVGSRVVLIACRPPPASGSPRRSPWSRSPVP